MTSDFGSDIFDPSDGPPPSKKDLADDQGAADRGQPDEPAAETSSAPPAKKATRRKKAAVVAEDGDEPAAGSTDTVGDDDAKVTKKATKKKTRKKRAKRVAEGDPIVADEELRDPEIPRFGADADESPSSATEDAEEAPPPRRRTRRKRAAAPSAEPADDATEPVTEDETTTEEEPARESGSRRRRAAARAEPTEEEPETGPNGDDEASDDERGPRRRRRRSRSRRGRGENGDATPEHRGSSRGGTRRTREWTADVGVGQRLAVFIDVDRVRDNARAFGGELAYGNLLRHIRKHRHLIRAVAYGRPETLESCASALIGSGFETRTIESDETLSVAVAVDAMAVAPRVDCVVVLPVTPTLEPLTDALRSSGVRIESAGFTSDHSDADLTLQFHHELGTESIFVP